MVTDYTTEEDCVGVLVSDSTAWLEEELHAQLRSSDLLKDQNLCEARPLVDPASEWRHSLDFQLSSAFWCTFINSVRNVKQRPYYCGRAAKALHYTDTSHSPRREAVLISDVASLQLQDEHAGESFFIHEINASARCTRAVCVAIWGDQGALISLKTGQINDQYRS